MIGLKSSLSRRTFLGGAGASVAMTLASSAAASLLSSDVLPVQVLVQSPEALLVLERVLSSIHVDVQAVLVTANPESKRDLGAAQERQRALRTGVESLLFSCGREASVIDLQPDSTSGLSRKKSSAQSTRLPMLLLGSLPPSLFSGDQSKKAPALSQRIRDSSWVYVDDPSAAARLTKTPPFNSAARAPIPGLCSVVDEAVDFMYQHLLCNELGSKLTEITTSVGMRDANNRLEANAIHSRLTFIVGASMFTPPLRVVRVAAGQPLMTISGRRGSLKVPLYTASDRQEMLSMRLQHFASLVRNEKHPPGRS